ncbi:MAG: hypothetical protein LC130_14860 [Bryobacterales bacterium]|nr:hypothetical protein [Bryobacterales bacterium]
MKTPQSKCSDDLLIAHLDDELPFYKAYFVRRHLQSCWRCRLRRAELEQQILTVTRAVEDDPLLSPHRIADARRRFWTWARDFADQRAPARSPCLALPDPKLSAALAMCFVLAVGLGLYRLSRTEPPPPARQLIARTLEVETRSFQNSVQQEFKVIILEVRPRPRRRTARLGIWFEPSQGRFTSRLDDERGSLRQALWRLESGAEYAYYPAKGRQAVPVQRSATIEPTIDTLFAERSTLEDFDAAFVRWLEARHWRPLSLAAGMALFGDSDGVTMRAEEVVTEDGRPCRRITAWRVRSGVSVQFTLDVDPYSQVPRLVRIRYEAPAQAFELQVAPHPSHELRAPAFAPYAPHPEREVVVRRGTPVAAKSPPAPASAAARDFTVLEIEVLYALHGVRACIGEPIEVVRSSERTLMVRGVVDSAERKEQLMTALSRVGHATDLSADIKTTAEILREIGPPGVHLKDRADGGPTFPDALERYFTGRPEKPSLAAARFVDQTLYRADTLMAEAWAVRTLSERFGPRLAHLPTRSAWLLEVMLREHLTELQTRARSMQEFVQPVFSALAGNAAFPRANAEPEHPTIAEDIGLSRVFAVTQRLHDRLRDWYGSGNRPVESSIVVWEILDGFAELDAAIRNSNQELALAEARHPAPDSDAFRAGAASK